MLQSVIGSGVILDGASPTSFSGLQYWFDATTIVATDNTAIASWSDVSGNGRTLSQGTGSKQPIYHSSGAQLINGKSTVTFDGIDDAFATSGFTLNQPVHIFMVFKQPTFVANGRLIDGLAGNVQGVVNFVGDTTLQLYAGGFGPSLTGPAAGTALMLRAQFNGASSKIGQGVQAYVTGDASTGNPGGLIMGAITPAGAAPANVTFGEIFAYNAILSAAQETALLAYLSAKWGT